jgi:hypothetical protein
MRSSAVGGRIGVIEISAFDMGHLMLGVRAGAKALDAWVAKQKPPVTRPEAIRTLLAEALEVEELG